MKSLILDYDDSLTYPTLVCRQTTNNFGDQILTFVREHHDGSFSEDLVLTATEGNWFQFTQMEMTRLYNQYCGRD